LTNNTKTQIVKGLATCDDCTIYNHRDARSKCENLCVTNFPDKNAQYTGQWSSTNTGAACECQYQGEYKKQFVGCAMGQKLSQEDDCFLWNNGEANHKCQFICNKYLPGKQSKWTGEWKNTSANTSACECELYD
jgi:hypothetical protein